MGADGAQSGRTAGTGGSPEQDWFEAGAEPMAKPRTTTRSA